MGNYVVTQFHASNRLNPLLFATLALSRLRAFLPAMHQANEDLARQQKATPTSVLDEFIQIEENGESDEEVEEYEEEDVEKVQEEPQGEEKKMIQMVRNEESRLLDVGLFLFASSTNPFACR